MSKPIEVPPIKVTGAPFPAPYVHRHKIRFGHTDAAKIAYTVRFFDYVMEALEGWFDEVLGTGWYQLNTEHNVGTPFVHVDMDMRAPLRPGDTVDVTVLVQETGRSSLRFAVSGRRNDGALSFRGEWVCAFIDTTTERPIRIPDAVARRIADYRRRCEAAAPEDEHERCLS